MVYPTVDTPPLHPPTSPQMVRSGAASGSHSHVTNDDDDYGDSATHPLLSKMTTPRDKSEIIQDMLAANDDTNGDGSGYGPGEEPPPPQAYPNTRPDAQTCVCHTGPLASLLCCMVRKGLTHRLPSLPLPTFY
jgi:hypothetical protein